MRHQNKTSKKGTSHLEMILSFVIFLGFLIFAFAIFRPLPFSSGKEAYSSSAERALKEYSSAEVGFLSISLDKEREKCFYVEYNNADYNLSSVIIKDSQENRINAFSSQDKRELYIDGRTTFYYIYSSSEFAEIPFSESCEKLNNGEYAFGLYRSYEMISNKSLHELEEEYNSDYEKLKEKLEIPKQADFYFYVRDMLNNIMFGVEDKGIKRGVLARDIPIQIVYSNGTFNYAILNLQVW